jgi:hypothetical protein
MTSRCPIARDPKLPDSACTCGIPCTCDTDPYNCPQGQKLAQDIIKRKRLGT